MFERLRKKGARLRRRLMNDPVVAKGKATDPMLMHDAISANLFDANWYQEQHKLSFNNPEEAFNDYCRKSKFSNVAPSVNFDPVSYFHNNPEVYSSTTVPLQHYLRNGINEGRTAYPLRPLWNTSDLIDVKKYAAKREGRYAVVLHIYYEDFIARFHSAFIGVDFDFDLYITSPFESVIDQSKKVFNQNPSIKNIKVVQTPNKGRNFGGFLVEFSEDLLNYDLICHIHSKKSLYSGSEQVHWAEYLLEYLARDKQILRNILNILEGDESLGMYFPTTFWNMPQWTCHWLKNQGYGKQVLKDWFQIEHAQDYFAYPAGGMFWAKPQAIRPLLERKWSYDDFPSEPIPSDGTILHVIERILPIVANKQGFDSFYYYPPTGAFTKDENFIFHEYQYGLDHRMSALCDQQTICSFDIFDTLIWRKYYEPDYAKYLLPEAAGLKIDALEFVAQRNEAELNIRKKKNFKGDVDIREIYQELVKMQVIKPEQVEELLELEFELDLSMIKPKEKMVDFLNHMYSKGKQIYIITDTYYLKSQIEKLLSVVGVIAPYKLFVSSENGMRKDNSTIWRYLSKTLKKNGHLDQFVHIGDNVVSDSQIPGDFGLRTMHILAPKDKWQAMNLTAIPKKALGLGNIKEMKKWGLLLASTGENPFI